MSGTLDIDPYAVLGVTKEATLPEIKSAHRKLVLKCHPDKIKDESQRCQAQDEFQKVQQAYELLSDETRRTKHDQKVRIAELRREVSSAHASSSREFRNGRIYEERTPADAFDEDVTYSDELPRTSSRKCDEYGTRQRTKAGTSTEEKRKSKSVPFSTTRTAKESARDSAKTTHSNRDKYRTRERRREVYEKYERAGPSPYGGSDDEGSDSSTVWVRMKRPSSSKQPSSSSARKSKSTSTSSMRYSDEYSDEYEHEHKLDKQTRELEDYVRRSQKGSASVDVDARYHRSSRSPLSYHDYETAEPESLPSRRPGRSKRSSKENVHSSSSRQGSYEKLDPLEHMPAAATSPPSKSTRPPLQSSRSASSYRPKREGSRQPDLLNMVRENPPRISKQRYDSGYSSPGPDMPPDLPKSSSTRYKVKEPETIIIESVPQHASPRHTRTRSPSRQTSRASKPTRSSTANYPLFSESGSRYEAMRPSASSRASSGLYYNEIPRPGADVTYREVRPDFRHPPPRRQSAFA
ncbi:hypothetical protein FE257_005320 [Aspergillus nanangensis]|uniref:J domain-containing protein n=1 Tax=Aspergillus nanangensis TaxID=2582783 RepID=A0AAD4CBI3_ASPNN|nr:hypothetical protein FE257_005320 [Aspergillus nanangensis]